MTASSRPRLVRRVAVLRPGRVTSLCRPLPRPSGRRISGMPRALRLKHQFQSMERKKMATPSRMTLSNCHSTVWSTLLSLMPMTGKVRSMNQQAAKRAFVRYCIMIGYTFCTFALPRMPSGRKMRMRMSRAKARASS